MIKRIPKVISLQYLESLVKQAEENDEKMKNKSLNKSRDERQNINSQCV